MSAERAGGEAEQQQRQQARRLDQGDERRRRREVAHQPRRGDGLEERADVRAELGGEQGGEDLVAQRRPRRQPRGIAPRPRSRPSSSRDRHGVPLWSRPVPADEGDALRSRRPARPCGSPARLRRRRRAERGHRCARRPGPSRRCRHAGALARRGHRPARDGAGVDHRPPRRRRHGRDQRLESTPTCSSSSSTRRSLGPTAALGVATADTPIERLADAARPAGVRGRRRAPRRARRTSPARAADASVDAVLAAAGAEPARSPPSCPAPLRPASSWPSTRARDARRRRRSGDRRPAARDDGRARAGRRRAAAAGPHRRRRADVRHAVDGRVRGRAVGGAHRRPRRPSASRPASAGCSARSSRRRPARRWSPSAGWSPSTARCSGGPRPTRSPGCRTATEFDAAGDRGARPPRLATAARRACW